MTILLIIAVVFVAANIALWAHIRDRGPQPKSLTEREVASRLRPHTSLVEVSGKRPRWP